MEYAKVLAYCNQVREELRRSSVKGLRKGNPRDHFHCSVAATINYGCRNHVSVDGSTVELCDFQHDERYIKDCPRYVSEFIRAFDEGSLPELEGEGWAE